MTTPADLIAAARAAARHAHAPYSNFAVGAALLLADGGIVTGCNFENASYGLSLCAETVALATANAQGRLADVVEIGVIGASVPPATTMSAAPSWMSWQPWPIASMPEVHPVDTTVAGPWAPKR